MNEYLCHYVTHICLVANKTDKCQISGIGIQLVSSNCFKLKVAALLALLLLRHGA